MMEKEEEEAAAASSCLWLPSLGLGDYLTKDFLWDVLEMNGVGKGRSKVYAS